MPSFHLVEVARISSFEEIVPVFWRSYTYPRDSAMEFVYPVKGNTKEGHMKQQSKIPRNALLLLINRIQQVTG